jgi:hypothetical protein
MVGKRAAGVLEDGGHSHMHGRFPSVADAMVNARLPAWEGGRRT